MAIELGLVLRLRLVFLLSIFQELLRFLRLLLEVRMRWILDVVLDCRISISYLSITRLSSTHMVALSRTFFFIAENGSRFRPVT